MPDVGPADGILEASLTARLERFAADARVDEAARRRARERWLRQAAEEEATFRGVLADLGERRTGVTVHTASGRSHHGVICAVAGDFAAVRTSAGREVLVAIDAIAAVRTRPGEERVAGDRVLRVDLDLAQVLDHLAGERERVLLVPRRGGEPITGRLVASGQDVLTLRIDGEPPGSAYIPSAAVGEVSVAP
jgi:hypothetical protein